MLFFSALKFKIEGEEIVFEDMDSFNTSLGAQFDEWDLREKSKEGKGEKI